MLQEGTFKSSATITEINSYGTWDVTYTKVILIETRDYGKGSRPYQTERTLRNGIQTFSAQYPADTEYAKTRREGITGW